MKSLSEIIKESRNKLGISQRELAKRIGVDNSYIAKIESGITKKPSIAVLMDLANELKLNVFQLCDSAEYSRKELNKIIRFSSDAYDTLKSLDIIESDNIEEYLSFDEEFDFEYIDIVKVLKGYKNGKINEKEAVQLIDFSKRISDIDNMTIYLSESGNIEVIYPDLYL